MRLSNKKGYVQTGPLEAIVVLLVFVVVLSAVFSGFCKDDKDKVSELSGKLSECQNTLGACQSNLSYCQDSLSNCSTSYSNLKEQCDKIKQPVNNYYLLQVFSDKVVILKSVVLYNFQLLGLFLAFGITFTIKLFEVNVEIKILSKENQRKLLRLIRYYLIKYPWGPVVVMLFWIALTNLYLALLK